MNITLIQIGKTFFDYIEKGVEDYRKRINRYVKFSIETYALPSKLNKLPPEALKEKESDLLAEVTKKYNYVILLDENGKEMTSVKFAGKINELMIASHRNIAFVIGGAYGVTNEFRKKCDFVLSLSQMTFSHQLVRLVFTEQLYRAFTIINNEKYHH